MYAGRDVSQAESSAGIAAATICTSVYLFVLGLIIATQRGDVGKTNVAILTVVASAALAFELLALLPRTSTRTGIALATWLSLVVASFYLISFSFMLWPALLFGWLAIYFRL